MAPLLQAHTNDDSFSSQMSSCKTYRYRRSSGQLSYCPTRSKSLTPVSWRCTDVGRSSAARCLNVGHRLLLCSLLSNSCHSSGNGYYRTPTQRLSMPKPLNMRRDERINRHPAKSRPIPASAPTNNSGQHGRQGNYIHNKWLKEREQAARPNVFTQNPPTAAPTGTRNSRNSSKSRNSSPDREAISPAWFFAGGAASMLRYCEQQASTSGLMPAYVQRPTYGSNARVGSSGAAPHLIGMPALQVAGNAVHMLGGFRAIDGRH